MGIHIKRWEPSPGVLGGHYCSVFHILPYLPRSLLCFYVKVEFDIYYFDFAY